MRLHDLRQLVASGACPVEHGHVPPDEIPGYWEDLAAARRAQREDAA